MNEEKVKVNPFVKFFKDWWIGLVDSFKYNPCKLPGILVALPGVFIGFFLGIHSNVQFYVNTTINEYDFSGLFMFVLVLMGCVNIFNGVTLMSKRNLGTVITSFACSILITVVGVLWIQRIFYSQYLVNSGIILLEGGALYTLGSNEWLSIVSVGLSIVCSLGGSILGYFKRNKNYKKVVF